METPLTPLEFQRRARALYGDREAVVDGSTRFSYEQFFARCDRWSAALQGLGVEKGDRVAYVSPNTHSQLESFYAVPQIGAVLVPINFRLTSEEVGYILRHCGAKVVPTRTTSLRSTQSAARAQTWRTALRSKVSTLGGTATSHSWSQGRGSWSGRRSTSETS